MILTILQAEQYAAQAGFSNTLVPGTNYTQQQVIVAIAQAESGLDTNAVNSSDPYGGSFGVLQINGSHFGRGITQQQALQPLAAFQYAHMLSNGGTDFHDWSTFTSGKYKKYITTLGQATGGQPVKAWWDFDRIDNFGSPDPQGGPKLDSNILLPANFPLIAPASGVVSGINTPNHPDQIPSYGAVITVKMDEPMNNLATHYAFLHLVTIEPSMRIGVRVNVGTVLGYGGANQSAGTKPAAVGFAFYPDDFYGFGPDWDRYVAKSGGIDPRLNPVPYLDALKNGVGTPNGYQLYSQNFSNTSPVTGLQLIDKVNNTIAPNDNVAVVLWAIDQTLLLQNPIPVSTPDQWPLGIPDLFEWVSELFTNLALDGAAIVLRGVFLFLGLYMCFRVINNITHLNVTIANAGKTALGFSELIA